MTLYNSKPKFFFILQLLPVKTHEFTAMKKMFSLKGFDVKAQLSKSASIKPLAFKPTGNLICITPKPSTVFETQIVSEVLRLKMAILVGVFFEGLFYNPKTVITASTWNVTTIIKCVEASALVKVPLMPIALLLSKLSHWHLGGIKP
jgi:hypothetical protein